MTNRISSGNDSPL